MNDPLGLDPLGLDDPLGLEKKAHIPRWPGDDGSLDITTKQDNSVESRTVRGLKGWGETALSLGTSIPATFLGGVAGLTAGINPLSKEKNPLNVFEKVSEDLTYSPRTEEGQRNVQAIGSALQFLPPVGGYLPHLSPRTPKPIGEPLREVPKPIEKPAAPKTTVDSLPPEVREQQAFFNRQQDPLGLDTELRAWEQPEPNRGDLSRQEGLPFTDSVEAVREAQVRGSPQPDMFVQENQLQRSFDPYQENLRKQADAERMDLERVAEESRKQQEMDAMLAKRQQDLFQEEQARKQENVADALSRVEERMNAKERPSTFRRNELGAIDIDAVKEGIANFRNNNKTALDVLQSFRGAFTEDEFAQIYAGLNSPEGRDALVLMSPQDFHYFAAGRSPHEINKMAKPLQDNVREGLASKRGLREIPYLTMDKSGQIIAHEGRHRMDVFKEKGIDLVPVRLRATNFSWHNVKEHPVSMVPQDAKNMSWQGKDIFKRLMPESRSMILPTKPGSPKYTLSGLGKNQRGGVDVETLSDLLPRMPYMAKVFERLPQNKPSFNKETILNELKRQDISDAERNVVREVLDDIPGQKVTAKELVDGFKKATEDFELSPRRSDEYSYYGLSNILRGGRDDATTNIWQLPEGINVGDNNHFGDPRYYGHTRNFKDAEGVRHIVEIQSDLVQRLNKELSETERTKLEKQQKEIEAQENALGKAHEIFSNQVLSSNIRKDHREIFELVEKYLMTSSENLAERYKNFGWNFSLELENYTLKNPENRHVLHDLFMKMDDNETIFDVVKEEIDFGRLSKAEESLVMSAMKNFVYDKLQGVLVNKAEIFSKLATTKKNELLSPITKNWLQRLVREELRDAALNGESVVRFADADTVAKVEGWPTIDYAHKVDLLKRNIAKAWPDGPGENPHPLYLNLKGHLTKAEENLKKYGPGTRIEFPQHQSIYDRYKKEYTKYLESIGGKKTVDEKGFGWIEVPVEEKRKGPLYMFGQRGVIDLNSISEGISKLARLGKNSPEIVPFVQEAARDKAREIVYNKIPNLEPFRSNIKTAEDVLARLDDPEYKDLSDTQLATGVSVKPGSRTVRVANNNPLVAFRQHTAMETMAQADNFAREYITGKDGVGPIWEKLPEKEQVELHRVLRVGDAEQRRFTPEELAEAGYTPKQIEFMEKYYKMEDFKLDLWNEQRLAIGMGPVAPRQGHFSSVFRGDFWSLVMEPDEKGNPRIVGFVGTDTKAGYNSVIEGLKKENSNYTFTPMKRRGLTGSFRRSDLAQGMSEMMEWLGQNDPRLEQIRQQIIDITSRNADAWLGADLHALDKKGIWGNEGNKPWEKDAGRASSEAMRAYLASWEEGVLSHLNLKPNAELTALLANPEVADKWPNAAAYVNRYSKHMTGTYTSQLAATVNNAVDLTTRVVSFNQLGPSSVRGAVNEYTKRMGQLTQGFANIVYTGMQWLQPFMTAMPEMYRAGNTINIGASAVAGFTDSLKYIRHMLDPNTELSPFQKEMFKFAEDKGLLTFSEYDDVSKVTQNKVSRNLDNAIDFNRNQLGERPTRPFVFFTFVDLLRKHETLPESEIFDTAYNLTQYSMTDYHPSERPMMYRELGVVGQLAGSLSQFKHSYTNQMIQWGKEVGKKPQMAIAGLAAVLTLSGYRGLPGYDDADAIVKWLTNKFGDKQVSIADIVSQNGPEWLAYEPVAYGALSAATGVNFSSRLGSAQLTPQTIPEAISPYAGKGIRLGEHALSIGTNPKALTNLGIEAAPSTVRGLLEDQLSTTDSGMLQNKKGQNEYQRTEFDRSVRRFGLTSLEESKARDKVYQGTQNKMKDDEARAKITGEAILKFNQLGKEWLKSEEFQKMRETYQKRGGDPSLLIEAIIQGKQEAGLTGKQRAEGINPDSLGSINRYKYFNDK